MTNLEEIATASPRMQGMSFGPADLAANRRMKTTRVGGGHPGYRVIEDPARRPRGARATAQQDPWHYSIARMVDACAGAGILPFYGPYGDIRDVQGCETQFRAAFLLGCVGAWSLHPVQIEIAKRVFSPDPEEVKFAKKVIEAIPDGRGVHMIDGKMQDDATWKQCRVMVELAEMLAARTRSSPRLTSSRRRVLAEGDASPRLVRLASYGGGYLTSSGRRRTLDPARSRPTEAVLVLRPRAASRSTRATTRNTRRRRGPSRRIRQRAPGPPAGAPRRRVKRHPAPGDRRPRSSAAPASR